MSHRLWGKNRASTSRGQASSSTSAAADQKVPILEFTAQMAIVIAAQTMRKKKKMPTNPPLKWSTKAPANCIRKKTKMPTIPPSKCRIVCGETIKLQLLEARLRLQLPLQLTKKFRSWNSLLKWLQ
ncbi:hypothetical protein Q3G72_010644 [Acer saccharum]|nr:hypothetical protein Q3G72_010644 [Acer saccharum]